MINEIFLPRTDLRPNIPSPLASHVRLDDLLAYAAKIIPIRTSDSDEDFCREVHEATDPERFSDADFYRDLEISVGPSSYVLRREVPFERWMSKSGLQDEFKSSAFLPILVLPRLRAIAYTICSLFRTLQALGAFIATALGGGDRFTPSYFKTETPPGFTQRNFATIVVFDADGKHEEEREPRKALAASALKAQAAGLGLSLLAIAMPNHAKKLAFGGDSGMQRIGCDKQAWEWGTPYVSKKRLPDGGTQLNASNSLI